MSKTKRLLSFVLVLATVFALFAGITVFAEEETTTTTATDTSAVGNFTDVNWSSPYAEAIAVLAAAKITTGTSDTTFGPTEKVTREQVAAFIARAGLSATQAEKLLPAETGFSDVPKSDFFSKYIAWGVSKGAIAGLGNGTYGPKGEVTGIQVLKILLGILNVDKVTELTGPQWETNTISYAIKLGLLEGVTVEDYSAPATREQIAQYILNALVTLGYQEVYSSYYNPASGSGTYTLTAAPLYEVNGLSRRQTENTKYLDDGSFEPAKTFTRVTPYGELYYRWETAADGKGITSWKHDDKNEKIYETIIANPTTTGKLTALGSPYASIFKFYINGAVVNAVGAGYLSGGIGNTIDNPSRFVTNEYTFNQGLAQTALAIVAGNPNFYGQVTDETWTGATIKLYEQRLSGDGVYDPVTGRYGTGADWYLTRTFDGKPDKAVVTYDYLGEVAFKNTANGVTTYEVDIFDATQDYTKTAGRSGNTATWTAKNQTGSYAVDDIVRIAPNLVTEVALPGAYRDWFVGSGTEYAAKETLNIMNNKFNYADPYTGIAVLELAKADTKTVTPSNYGYAWSSGGSTQTATTSKQGMYISATTGGTLDWISGTYQEILRAQKNDLYADGTKYTVWLDKNGYILGGFSTSGAEYAFLTSAASNENSLTSTWNWIDTNGVERRSMTYYPGIDTWNLGHTTQLDNAFKELWRTTSTLADKNNYTSATRDMDNGILKANTTVSGNATYVYVGDVVRVFNNVAKVLQGTIYNVTDLPSDGKLYVEVTWDVFANNFAFVQRSASDARTNYKRNSANATIYRYVDRENYIKDDDYTVYVISYTPFYSAPRVSPTGSVNTGDIANLVAEAGAGAETFVAANYALTLAAPITQRTRINYTVKNSDDPSYNSTGSFVITNYAHYTGAGNEIIVDYGDTAEWQLTDILSQLGSIGVLDQIGSISTSGGSATAAFDYSNSYDGYADLMNSFTITMNGGITFTQTVTAVDSAVAETDTIYAINAPQLKAGQKVSATLYDSAGAVVTKVTLTLGTAYNTLNANGASNTLASDVFKVLSNNLSLSDSTGAYLSAGTTAVINNTSGNVAVAIGGNTNEIVTSIVPTSGPHYTLKVAILS